MFMYYLLSRGDNTKNDRYGGSQLTLIRLGYVAMSVHLKNASPSQTMTYKQFSKLANREAAIYKLEKISRSNLGNCLRLLRYNLEHDIHFFRFSSRLIPLAGHKDLQDWDYLAPIQEEMTEIKKLLQEKPHIRIDFHPDHFVLLNSPKATVLNQSIQTLQIHRHLLKGFGIDPAHRCVIHVGGSYDDKEKAMEQFIHNWGFVPPSIQAMLMLENDDKVFTVNDTLYLCEKLGIPHIFDLHHHEANHDNESWEKEWDRIVATWEHSKLPIKIHISSPKSDQNFRAHADYIVPKSFQRFLDTIKGSVDQVDVMIEAKRKDDALFQLVRDLKAAKQYEWVNQASFLLK